MTWWIKNNEAYKVLKFLENPLKKGGDDVSVFCYGKQQNLVVLIWPERLQRCGCKIHIVVPCPNPLLEKKRAQCCLWTSTETLLKGVLIQQKLKSIHPFTVATNPVQGHVWLVLIPDDSGPRKTNRNIKSQIAVPVLQECFIKRDQVVTWNWFQPNHCLVCPFWATVVTHIKTNEWMLFTL